MERIGRPQRLKGATAGDRLMSVPILRGWDGNPDAKDWMTVGTGRKLAAVQCKKEKLSEGHGDIEEEWKEWSTVLSKDFVEYAKTSKFQMFRCPSCSKFI